jgi:hypothetical protein
MKVVKVNPGHGSENKPGGAFWLDAISKLERFTARKQPSPDCACRY